MKMGSLWSPREIRYAKKKKKSLYHTVESVLYFFIQGISFFFFLMQSLVLNKSFTGNCFYWRNVVAGVEFLSCVQLSCTFIDWNKPGIPILCYLLEFAQTHTHWVNDAIQQPNPLSSPYSEGIRWVFGKFWSSIKMLSIKPTSLVFSALAGAFFTTGAHELLVKNLEV